MTKPKHCPHCQQTTTYERIGTYVDREIWVCLECGQREIVWLNRRTDRGME